MSDEIHLVSDGDGLAVIGEATLVERFLASEGLTAKELDVQRLGATFSSAAGVAQAGSEMAANSGRWMKLTQESAQVAKNVPLVKNSKTGYSHATARAKNGQFVKNLQFENGMGALVTNPAILTGVAGIMAQMAMQQTFDEITNYLATIDEKVDDVLRGQKDAVLADMIGVDLSIEEAMRIREQVGRVSEVTWSKIDSTSTTIARTQAYALRQLNSFAEKLERKSKIGDLADVVEEIGPKVDEWLAVLARSFQLQEALGILELDRVFDASPEELDDHRLGLRTARHNRLEAISQSTNILLERMNAAARLANSKVLFHPKAAPQIVSSSNHAAANVVDFQARLGIENPHTELEALQWRAAVADTRDRVIETGAEVVDATKQLSNDALEKAKTTKNKLSRGAQAFRLALKNDEVADNQTPNEGPDKLLEGPECRGEAEEQ